jgi:hypothetical protein
LPYLSAWSTAYTPLVSIKYVEWMVGTVDSWEVCSSYKACLWAICILQLALWPDKRGCLWTAWDSDCQAVLIPSLSSPYPQFGSGFRSLCLPLVTQPMNDPGLFRHLCKFSHFPPTMLWSHSFSESFSHMSFFSKSTLFMN